MAATIQGLKTLTIKLDKIADDTKIKDALEKSCLLVERDAKILCPVDDGTLRNSITYEVSGYEGVIGTNVEYAPYVHQGTGIYAVNHDGRKDAWSYRDANGNWYSTRGQRPNPFLRKALVQNKENILKIFKESIGDSVN